MEAHDDLSTTAPSLTDSSFQHKKTKYALPRSSSLGMNPSSPANAHPKRATVVLLVTNVYAPHIGGITSYVSNLVRGLGERFEAKVVAYPNLFVEFEERFPRSKARFLSHGVFVAAVLVVALSKRLRGRQVVLHSHSAAFCMLPGILARPFGVRTVHTIHSPLARPSRLIEALTPRLDALIFASAFLRDAYRDGTRARNRHEFIIPGAVDIPPPRTVEERARVRANVEREWSIPPGSALVLYAGRVVEDKGVDVLARAASRLSEKDGCVLVAGPAGSTPADLEYYRRLNDLAGPAMQQGRFRLLGRITRKQLDILYSACDVVVVPSRWPEPAPMAAIEAMAHGSALIVSRIGGLPDLVPEGEAGLLVPPGDDAALADAIRTIVHDPALRGRLSEQGRALAEVRHALVPFAQRHESIYDSTLGNAVTS